MSEDVHARVKRVLVDSLLKDYNVVDFDNDAPLIEFGVGADSVSRLEFLVALEEEFHIKLDEGEITPAFFETVDSISEHVSKLLTAD